MKRNKTVLLLLVILIALAVGFYLFTYFTDAKSARTSLLDADSSDTANSEEEIITPNHFQKNSKNYTLELTETGEVTER